jgi:hypothetical protein
VTTTPASTPRDPEFDWFPAGVAALAVSFTVTEGVKVFGAVTLELTGAALQVSVLAPGVQAKPVGKALADGVLALVIASNEYAPIPPVAV